MQRRRIGAAHRPLEPRLAAMLSDLLGVLSGVILLSVARESRFVRFHALQSILYSSFVAVTLVALTVSGLMMLSGIVGLLAVAVWLFLIQQAALGRWFPLPGLGWLAERSA